MVKTIPHALTYCMPMESRAEEGVYTVYRTLYCIYQVIYFGAKNTINTPIVSAFPLYTDSGCGKERRALIVRGDNCKGSTRSSNYLEDYWPCAGGLSAVNAIGTQLRDPINSGLTRWRMAV